MARPFHFTLEPIRTLREHAERDAMRQLAIELDEQLALERRRDDAQRRLDEARSADAGTSARDLVARQRFVERVERELESLAVQAERQQRRVDAVRGRLAEAMRERETLDRLEQQRRETHAAEERRLERTAGDELSLAVHLRAGSALS